MKREINALKSVVRNVAVRLARVEGDVAEIKQNYATKAEMQRGFDAMHARFDEFLPLIEGARRDRALASDAYMRVNRRLDSHDRRLTKLERRPS